MTTAFLSANLPLLVGFESECDDAVLLAGTGAEIAAAMRDAGHRVATVDEHPDDPLLRDAVLASAALLEHPRIVSTLRGERVDGIVPFKPSVALERAAQRLGIAVLSAPARLVRQLENKLQLPGIAAEAGVRFPATEQVLVDDALVERIRAGAFALPQIFQPAMAFAGAGTTAVRSVADAGALLRDQPRVAGKLAELVDGEPVTVNAVVLGDGAVLVGTAARQLTGIPELTAAPFGSAGNDWSLPLPDAQHAAARATADAVGRVLHQRGFRGLFGIDVVLTAAGDAVLIEVNPRITASLGAQTQLQRRAGLPTLVQGHLAAFERPAPAAVHLREVWDATQPAPHLGPAANLLLFNRTGGPAPAPAFAPGAWSLDAATGRLEFRRPAWRLDHLHDPSELLLLGAGVARPVSSGASTMRVGMLRQAVATPAATSLLDDLPPLLAAIERP